MPRKLQPSRKEYEADISVRLRFESPNSPQARLLASQLSQFLRSLELKDADIHSTKVQSILLVRRNIAEEQEQRKKEEAHTPSPNYVIDEEHPRFHPSHAET
jgi:hypothetical protein